MFSIRCGAKSDKKNCDKVKVKKLRFGGTYHKIIRKAD